jgi:hypothetical protein
MEGEDMFHQAGTQLLDASGDITYIRVDGSAMDPLLTFYHQLPNGDNRHSGFWEGLGDIATDGIDALTAPFAILGPGVSFSFRMKFDLSEETIEVRPWSVHDGFPSYELFARFNGGAWHNLYFWDSKEEGQSPFSMFGNGEIVITAPITKDLTP